MYKEVSLAMCLGDRLSLYVFEVYAGTVEKNLIIRKPEISAISSYAK